MNIDDVHVSLVNENYTNATEYFRSEFREAILQKQVVKGMWPTEALLAGGGGSYRVNADEKVWSKNSNPMDVMRAQSLKPDNSQIEIVFFNCYQFAQNKHCKFTAFFTRGVCTDIKEK